MTIGEVSKKLGISVDTLRYYEKIGLINPIARNKSGIRDYAETDLKQIEFVKCMRSANLPIEALTKYMTLFKEGDKTISERREILVHQREQILKQIKEWQEVEKRLDKKIKLYDEKLLEKKLT